MSSEKLAGVINYGLEDQGGFSSCNYEGVSNKEGNSASCGYCGIDIKCNGYAYCKGECHDYCYSSVGYSGSNLDACVNGCYAAASRCVG